MKTSKLTRLKYIKWNHNIKIRWNKNIEKSIQFTYACLENQKKRANQMWFYFIKLLISAASIVLISEVAKRYSLIGGIIASFPVVSILALIWLYHDTKDIKAVCSLSSNILWMLIPSLVLFLALPYMLKRGYSFYSSLFTSCFIMICSYGLTIAILKFFKVDLN